MTVSPLGQLCHPNSLSAISNVLILVATGRFPRVVFILCVSVPDMWSGDAQRHFHITLCCLGICPCHVVGRRQKCADSSVCLLFLGLLNDFVSLLDISWV